MTINTARLTKAIKVDGHTFEAGTLVKVTSHGKNGANIELMFPAGYVQRHTVAGGGIGVIITANERGNESEREAAQIWS